MEQSSGVGSWWPWSEDWRSNWIVAFWRRSEPPPNFCKDTVIYNNAKNACNALWDVIDKNRDSLPDEVWSWVYKDGKFWQTPLGSLPLPPGAEGVAESDMIQLWSLTFWPSQGTKA